MLKWLGSKVPFTQLLIHDFLRMRFEEFWVRKFVSQIEIELFIWEALCKKVKSQIFQLLQKNRNQFLMAFLKKMLVLKLFHEL